MTASSPVKINREHFKEMMTAILSVTKTDTLVQARNGCNQSSENDNKLKESEKKKILNKKYLKNRMPKIVAIFNK